MAVQLQGNGGAVAEVGGTTFRALRVESRPLDHGALGQYRLSTTAALPATATAGGTRFSMRWGDATRLCVIQYIRLQCIQTAAATATIFPSFQVFIARSFSASDSAGTVLSFTGDNAKKRTSMASSLMTDARFGVVAAGLTVGTRTLDASPILELPTQQTITTPNTSLFRNELDMTNGGDHPVILAQNEGIIVRGPTIAFGAAGTANLVIDVAWSEVNSY